MDNHYNITTQADRVIQNLPTTVYHTILHEQLYQIVYQYLVKEFRKAYDAGFSDAETLNKFEKTDGNESNPRGIDFSIPSVDESDNNIFNL